MIRIVALTIAGRILATQLRFLIGRSNDSRKVIVDFKPQPFTATIQQAFVDKEALILICATGIAVRSLAPVIVDKKTDPPVLVLDEYGKFVIPLLSGHEGGANEWARQISELLSAQLVMSTTDAYLKPIYSVGMGCERDCPLSELDQLLQQCLIQQGLQIEQLSNLNSIALKADEVALIALAKKYDLSFDTWSVAELKQVQAQLATPSDYVLKTVGVYGVAESAALYSAQNQTGNVAELLLSKQKSQGATCAIARSYGN